MRRRRKREIVAALRCESLLCCAVSRPDRLAPSARPAAECTAAGAN